MPNTRKNILKSDMTSKQVTEMVKVDRSNIDDLMVYACQLPKKLKFPKEFLVKALCRDFLADRARKCGDRLATFAQKGGIGDDSGPKFEGETGCYKTEVNEQEFVIAITHVATGTRVEVDPKTGISKAWRLRDNHDDFSCSFVMGIMQPVPLSTFFDKKQKEGPWRPQCFKGGRKTWRPWRRTCTASTWQSRSA